MRHVAPITTTRTASHKPDAGLDLQETLAEEIDLDGEDRSQYFRRVVVETVRARNRFRTLGL